MTIANNVSTDLSVLRFHLVLTLRGEAVKTLHTRKRKRIAHVSNVHEFDAAHLRVTYGNSGAENEGIYGNRADLLAALSAFTESELIDGLVAA